MKTKIKIQALIKLICLGIVIVLASVAYKNISRRVEDLVDTVSVLSEDAYSLPFKIMQVSTSVVKVKTNTHSGIAYGSGVVISPREILTNEHVVRGNVGISVILHDNTVFEVESVRTSDIYDCAVITTKKKLPHVAKLGSSGTILRGDRIFTVTSPYRKLGTASYGIISKRFPHAFYVDAIANPGSSGGPVFNMQCEVIGIVQGTYSRYGNGTTIVAIDSCKALINDQEPNTAEDTGIK